MPKKATIAFVYDWFDTSVGGAERVIQELHELYPNAPWYTSHIDRKTVSWAKGWDIRPSFLQYLPLWFRRNRILSLLLLPFAFESFDMSRYEIVVSVTSAFAKGVVTNAKTKHICYLLTPPRWIYKFQVPSTKFQVINYVMQKAKKYLQKWDYVAAQRVDEYISISQEVAKRCREHYGRESEVAYPPFEYEKWQALIPKSLDSALSTQHSALIHFPYYLVVSRLEPYKKVDVAIEAYAKFKVQSSKLRVPSQSERLIIVGSGSQKAKLKTLSVKLNINEYILWVDGLSDEELVRLYAHCKAFIMPQEEDFGYVACEAMACDAPIVAYAHGGQTEILADYPNKVLCDEQNVECFAEALEKLGAIQYNAQTYENSHIRRGSRDTFVAAFSQKIT
jgi:glycosyltransferase involved in cell wall biosynthesis